MGRCIDNTTPRNILETMQFHDYITTRDLIGHDVPVNAFCQEDFSFALDNLDNLHEMRDECTALQMASEGLWEEHRRPYYNVYPAIAPMLMRLNLDIDTRFIRPPVPAFCVRLSQEKTLLSFTWQGQPWHVRSILVGPALLRNQGNVFKGLMLWVNTGEVKRCPDGKDYPVHTYINLPLESGMSLEKC